MKRQLGFVINLGRCLGCRTCVVACKMENGVLPGQFRMRVLNSENEMVHDRPTGTFPRLSMEWLPMPCQHCGDPPCVSECPSDAIQKREKDGIVLIDKGKCIGCRLCLEACPYSVPSFDEETQTADKCTFCVHRIDSGADPFCANVCPGRAIHFGDLNDAGFLKGLLQFKRHRVLGKDYGTQPSVFYIVE